ncbi:PAS domain-containing protein [Brevundimonas denitrificans]|uniref:PAS domain-containing protein n=1 Tax=Brevundimonas denitrificans TaxID=1443434 RepID=UPI00223B85A6|nr:PAS domain-containing protein [Brevundimonas denitrificans]
MDERRAGRLRLPQQGSARVLGRPDDLSQFDWTATLHPEDAPDVHQVAMDAAMAGQGFEVEARYRRNDGHWRIVHTNARPRLDSEGRFFGMIGVNLDVTDTRMVEDGCATTRPN